MRTTGPKVAPKPAQALETKPITLLLGCLLYTSPMMELLDLEEGAERIKRDENLIRKLSYEFDIPAEIIRTVSYTHLDVYKRQALTGGFLH